LGQKCLEFSEIKPFSLQVQHGPKDMFCLLTSRSYLEF